MKKIFSMLLSIVFVLALVSMAWAGGQLPLGGTKQSTVCLKDYCFDVEIVQTQKDRQKGLQNRKSLKMNKGMLFIFEKSGIYSFWMKDTLISLDIIWLDQKKNVVFIEENVPPCKKDPCSLYSPKVEAKYVLEVSAGRAKDVNISVGAKAMFYLKE